MPDNTLGKPLTAETAFTIRTALIARQRFFIEALRETLENYDDDGNDYFSKQLDELHAAWDFLFPNDPMPSGW